MTVLREIAAGVHVTRHGVRATLVVGDDLALVVDTLADEAQARGLLAAVRRVTALPLVVVNTHEHAGHCGGNAVFAAEGASRVAVPDHAGPAPVPVPLGGGRVVHLRHAGRGHSAGDLVALVPDADVAVVGDLVEQGGPPRFDDAYPLEWPDTLAALQPALTGQTQVVPGHGTVVDAAFVRAQHEQLAALAWLIRDGDADGAPAERVAERSPFEGSLTAVRRGYAQLHKP